MRPRRLWIPGLALLVAIAIWPCAARADSDAELDAQIARLIAQLGDPQFAVRQRAQQELVKLGFDAFDALSDAENSDDPEIAMQAGYLVRLIRVEWTHDSDPRQVQTILRDYEAQSDQLRLLKIKQLADLPGDLGLEWLCRLVRFERSPIVSKQAALAIMNGGDGLDIDWNRRAEIIGRMLHRARRPPAGWLAVYVQAHDDPAGALEKWGPLTEAERQVLEHHPQETNSQIVMKLLRRQVDLLDRLGRAGEVPDVLHQMVLCERGDTASLAELIDWLSRRKAWDVVDEVATRFAASFDSDPVLLYSLCEVRLAQGNKELADQAAERALQLSGDKPLEHMDVANRLLERGLTTGSDRELRYVIKLGPLTSLAAVNARLVLGESLHDRMLDLEAGETLQELMDAADKDSNVEAEIRRLLQTKEQPPNLLRARMYYYFACHAAAQHDPARQRELLAKAIEQDSADVDALIALYRLTQDDAAARADVLALIK